MDEAGTVLQGEYFETASNEYLREEVRTQREIPRKRRELYTCAQKAVDPADRVVIIVDDGIATGSPIRAQQPRRIVVAIGVAPATSLARMRAEADEVVCLHAPEDFYAVGQFFEDFSEVTDERVVEALARPRSPLLPQTT